MSHKPQIASSRQGAREVVGCCCIRCFKGWEASHLPQNGHQHWSPATYGGLIEQAKNGDEWWPQREKIWKIHWEEWGSFIHSYSQRYCHCIRDYGVISINGGDTYRDQDGLSDPNTQILVDCWGIWWLEAVKGPHRLQEKHISLYLKSYPLAIRVSVTNFLLRRKPLGFTPFQFRPSILKFIPCQLCRFT